MEQKCKNKITNELAICCCYMLDVCFAFLCIFNPFAFFASKSQVSHFRTWFFNNSSTFLLLIIFALREDLICHFSNTYCLRKQGDRVLFRLFCTIYQSVMLVHVLNEIATLWLITRVSHFGKKFEFCSANPGSHSNRYIREIS